MTTISVDPYILTCAVRFALRTGGSGLARLIADEIEASWRDLGSQQHTITRDVNDYLRRSMYSSDPIDSSYHVWQELADWIDHHG